MLLFLLSCLVSGESSDYRNYEVDWVEVGYKKNTNNISQSSLKVVIKNGEEEVGHGSGNYFKYGKYEFVVTAAHVIDNEMEVFVADGIDEVKAKVVFVDFVNDVAILSTEHQLQTIKPMRWRLNKSKRLAGSTIYYSGYPSSYGKLLVKGMVSSQDDSRVIIQSFALPGSSGSVVFDDHGRVVGILTAVALHAAQFSPYPSIQEDIVYVSTVKHVSIDKIIEVIECGR